MPSGHLESLYGQLAQLQRMLSEIVKIGNYIPPSAYFPVSITSSYSTEEMRVFLPF